MESELLLIDQGGCEGNPYDAKTRPIVRLSGDALIVQGLRHRCNQRLEARAKRRDGVLVVMIQPADLDPESVARCSCLYTLRVQLPRDDGWSRLRVLNRGDNYGRSSPSPVVSMGEIDRVAGDGPLSGGGLLPFWHQRRRS